MTEKEKQERQVVKKIATLITTNTSKSRGTLRRDGHRI